MTPLPTAPAIDDQTAWVESAARAASARDRDFLASGFFQQIAQVTAAGGATQRAGVLRSVLRALIERNRPCISAQNLPEAVKALIEREFRRIEKDLAKAADEHFDLSDHSMRCDFRILAFGRIPVGVHHVELGGVPRRLIWSGGLTQAWRTATLLAEAGGHAPFYVSHFSHGIKPWAFLMVYNAEALAVWHRNVAECLRLNPEVRGLLATSWWYDPQLATVSPHLAFLREGSIAHGGVLLKAGSTEGARKYAVANSPERQKLYAAGEYIPVSYALLWTRDALLRWADR